jgi:hypothetical protein
MNMTGLHRHSMRERCRINFMVAVGMLDEQTTQK